MAGAVPSAPPQPPSWLGRARKSSALDRASPVVAAMAGVAEAWTKSFAELAGRPIEMVCRDLRLASLPDVIAARGTPICGVLRVPSAAAEITVVMARSLVSGLVTALLGGQDEGETVDLAGPSAFEWQIAEVFARHLADALTSGLGDEAGLAVVFDRLSPKPEAGPAGKSEQPFGVLPFAVAGCGEFDLLLPGSLLESLGEALADDTKEPPVEHDPRWSRQLGDEVGRAMTRLQAVIDVAPTTLGAILNLVPGQVLPLVPAARGRVRLASGRSDLFRCELGQQSGHYTVRIDDVLAAGVDPEPTNPHGHA